MLPVNKWRMVTVHFGEENPAGELDGSIPATLHYGHEYSITLR